MIAAFLFVLVGIVLFIVGRSYQDSTLGIFGGLIIFLAGVALIIDPITDITSLMNTILAFSLFGVGGYIWVRGSLESLNKEV
jgi:hypothetical protein